MSCCSAKRHPLAKLFGEGGLSLVAVVALGLFLPGIAAAAWSSPVIISPVTQNAHTAKAQVSGAGDAVFYWTFFDGGHDQLVSRTRSAAGVLGPVRTVSSPDENARHPDLGLDGRGNGLFVWVGDMVRARAMSSAGILGPVETVGSDYPYPQVEVARGGNAVAMIGADSRLQARPRPAGGPFGAVENISPRVVAPPGNVDPQIALNPNGDAVFAWTDSSLDQVQARARSAAGSLGRVQPISRAGPDTHEAQVAIASDGDAALAWRRHFDPPRIEFRTRSATGALGPIYTISSDSEDASKPAVAVDDAGNAIVAWRGTSDNRPRFFARAISAAGVLGPIQMISPADLIAEGKPLVAFNREGRAIFAWTAVDGGIPQRVQVRTRSTAGGLDPIRTVSNPAVGAYAPNLALGPRGRAVVSWNAGAGGAMRVQASFGP